VAVVLRALQPHREAETALTQPVNAAYQYLHKRRDHLDYAATRRQSLPIGSGEIESGHRHVIQTAPQTGGLLVEGNPRPSHAQPARRPRQQPLELLLVKKLNGSLNLTH